MGEALGGDWGPLRLQRALTFLWGTLPVVIRIKGHQGMQADLLSFASSGGKAGFPASPL